MYKNEPNDTSLERPDPVVLVVGHQDDAVKTNLPRLEQDEPSTVPQMEPVVTTQRHEEPRLPGGRQDEPLDADLQRHGPGVESDSQHNQPVIADCERDQQNGPAGQEEVPVIADVQRGGPVGSSDDLPSNYLGTTHQVSGAGVANGDRPEDGLNTNVRDEPTPPRRGENEPTIVDFRSTSSDPDDQIAEKTPVKVDFPPAHENDIGGTNMGGTDDENSLLFSPVDMTETPGFSYRIPRYFHYLIQMFRNFLAFFVRGGLSTLMFTCDLLLSSLIFVFHTVLGIPGVGLIGSAARVALFICQLIIWVLFTTVELIFFLPPVLLVPYLGLLFLVYIYLPDAMTSFFEAIVGGAHKMLHLVKGVAVKPI